MTNGREEIAPGPDRNRHQKGVIDMFVAEITPDERDSLLTALLPIVERITRQ